MRSSWIPTTVARIHFSYRLRRSSKSYSYFGSQARYRKASKSSPARRSRYATIPSSLASAGDPGVGAWFALATKRDYEFAEAEAKRALAKEPSSRFARSALAEIACVRSRFEEAADHIEAARTYHPHNKWYRLTLADIYLEGKELDKAVRVLKESQDVPGLERHVYKRLARVYYRLGNFPASLFWQEKLVGLAPNYLVYASDYSFLAWLQLRVLDDAKAALNTLRAGARIYRRNAEIKDAISFLESDPPATGPDDGLYSRWDAGPVRRPRPSFEKARPLEAFPGVLRTPISTPLVTMHTDLASLIDAATSAMREPGDTVAISESVLAISQGRAIPLELVDPGPLARLLCKFVGTDGPLHSPEGMQGAISEAGVVRILAAAASGGVAKLAGKRGVFYKVAGAPCAMIDDVAACMPPFDHHLILGPADPDGYAQFAAEKLGCRVCVVDANNKTGAWIVGASPGVDRAMVEQVLQDNPAGNEDEQTPIVLIKGL